MRYHVEMQIFKWVSLAALFNWNTILRLPPIAAAQAAQQMLICFVYCIRM